MYLEYKGKVAVQSITSPHEGARIVWTLDGLPQPEEGNWWISAEAIPVYGLDELPELACNPVKPHHRVYHNRRQGKVHVYTGYGDFEQEFIVSPMADGRTRLYYDSGYDSRRDFRAIISAEYAEVLAAFHIAVLY